MDKLVQNVINIMGESGKNWISSLPDAMQILADYWQLSNIVPVDNMSFNYVVKATGNTRQPVVLKIGFDADAIRAEKGALIYFAGNAVVRLIDYNEKYNALLLEQAIPGTPLKSFYPANAEFVINCYGDTLKRLFSKPYSGKHGFHHVTDWLKVLDGFKSDRLPEFLLAKAIYLRNKLLTSMGEEKLLHGDLHQENILKNGDSWIAIDPKGVIGEPEFEIAAFDFIHDTELANNVDVKELFLSRVNMIAASSNLNAKRIKDWVIVRLVLSAVWIIEDNGDPSFAIKLMKGIV